MKHALLSPSSSHRWIPCPGSLAMSRDEPKTTSEYSDHGTAAHHLAAEVLKHGCQPQAFFGMMIGLWEDGERMFHPAPEPEPNPPPRVRYYVDAELIAPVQVYVDAVREYARGHTLLVEQRLSIEHVTGEEGAEGTSDAVIVAGTELQVHDLKFGMGNRVDADDNSQLKIYALAALEDLSFMGDFDIVRLVIHQPRLEHLSEWTCSVEDLKEWAEMIVAPRAHDALHLYAHPEELTGIGEALSLQAGEHCRTGFCPARGKCPAHDEFVTENVGASFENLDEVKAAVEEMKKPTDDTILASLGKKLKAVDVIEDWCTAVRARVESLLIRQGNDPATTEALGFKLVQGRRGNRAWQDEATAEAALKALKLKADEMYTKKLISPTKAEELLKASPKKWEKVIPIIVQPDGKPSVAPLKDERPPLVIPATADAFENLEGGDLV